MSFFSLAVESGKGYTMDVEEAFRLTNACLGTFDGNARSVLKAVVDEDEIVLCSLTPGKQEQFSLDLILSEGESVTFKVEGKNPVHISGNYLTDPMMMMDDGFDEEDDEEIVSSDDDDEVMQSDDDSEVADSGLGSDLAAARIQEVVASSEDEAPETVEGDGASDVSENSEVDSEGSEVEEEEEDSEAEEEEEQLMAGKNKRASEQQAKKEAVKKVRVEEEPKKPQQQQQKEEAKGGEKKTLPSGLVIEDSKRGEGARAKNGKRVSVRYIGKLTSGKVFDSNTKGKPFTFVLGRGEVIKGWDIGVQGMQVGGMRRLTIPPQLAYGSQGAPPDIPKNATLTFDVKLMSVNQINKLF